MVILVREYDNRVIAVGDSFQEVEGGFLIEDTVYCLSETIVCFAIDSVPEEVIDYPNTYFYISNEGFVKDINWKPYKAPELIITELQQQVADLQIALAGLIGGAV